ncbi:MAG: hypothetical protein ACLQHK_14225 [Gallionellaceae bacterium]
MKRITLILKTSEVMSVRKAACIAGASHVIVHPVSHRECAWFPSPQASAEGAPVRLDVMVVDRLSDEVVSAILATAHLGKIEKISTANARQASHSLCRLAA